MMKFLNKLEFKIWHFTETGHYKHAAFGMLLALPLWRIKGAWWCLLPPLIYGICKETFDIARGKYDGFDHLVDIADYVAGGLIVQLILWGR